MRISRALVVSTAAAAIALLAVLFCVENFGTSQPVASPLAQPGHTQALQRLADNEDEGNPDDPQLQPSEQQEEEQEEQGENGGGR